MLEKAFRPLWKCPRCGNRFANRNQLHSCGEFTVQQHLVGKSPEILDLFREFVARVKQCGPFRFHPVKTRIGFVVRMTFGALALRKRWIDGHLLLRKKYSHPAVYRLETHKNFIIHHFRLKQLSDLDEDLETLIRESYKIGEQQHLINR